MKGDYGNLTVSAKLCTASVHFVEAHIMQNDKIIFCFFIWFIICLYLSSITGLFVPGKESQKP